MTDLQTEVAAPGALFWEVVTHPDNIEILEGDERTRKLPQDRLKAAVQKAATLQAGLNLYWSAYIEHLTVQAERIKARSARMSEDEAAEAVEMLQKIDGRIAQVKDHIRPTPKVKAPYPIRTMTQAKEAQVTVWRLNARIDEHYKAVENEMINQRLQDEMAAEINFYAQQIVDRWSALGFREEYMVDGKRIVNKVHFEEAHFTEDTIQFKVYVSHLTVLGSTVHHLPNGVKAWDLVKPDTLAELEAACECPITSPHNEDGQGFEKGCWLVVHRVGMRDGLFNYVELNKVLAKYNQGLRAHFALPVGIKAGRQVEYLYLDKVPHLMINGITGSGKTNVVRVFLAVLSQFYSPDEIRFVLIDLKRSGDLNHFAKVPHMIGGIVKDVAALEILVPQLVALMHERMKRFSDANCFDIIEYNKKALPENREPRILVLIDECGSIGDLASSAQQRDTIYRGLALISAQARASGIQLMLGTQQPSKEAIPTKITNNITYTISGRQRTTSGAMSALGNNRLKNLPAIKGRMLVDNGFGLIPVQTPFATEGDIVNAVKRAQEYTAKDFTLPGAEDSIDIMDAVEAEVIAAMQGVTPEKIIEHAVEHNNGLLAPMKIWSWANGVTSRPKIQAMVKEIVAQGVVKWRGDLYVIKPAGRGHRVELSEVQEEQSSPVADSDDPSVTNSAYQQELRENA